MIPPPRWRTEGADWPNREASRFVTAGSVRWHVQVAGPVPAAASQPPVVLLLHGTGAASHSWRDIMPDLSRDYTVVAPDLPGHGFSSGLGSPTLPAMARAVTALLAELGLEPALIVGHSAGAAIGLRLAIDLQQAIPLISFNGALLPFPGIAAKLFPAMAKLLFVNPLVPAIFALQARGPGVVQGFLERATGSRIDARGVDLYARLFRRRDHVAAALAMMAHWDLAGLAADFGRVRGLVRLVYGDRDAAVPPSVAVDVSKRIAGSATVAMPGLGHLAHEEDPAAAIRIILDALSVRV